MKDEKIFVERIKKGTSLVPISWLGEKINEIRTKISEEDSTKFPPSFFLEITPNLEINLVAYGLEYIKTDKQGSGEMKPYIIRKEIVNFLKGAVHPTRKGKPGDIDVRNNAKK